MNTQPLLFAVPDPEKTTLEETTPGELESTAAALFEELDRAGLLGPLELAKRPALIKTARNLDHGLSQAKTTVATATIFKQYFEALETLPKIQTSGNKDMDALDLTLQMLTREALEGKE